MLKFPGVKLLKREDHHLSTSKIKVKSEINPTLTASETFTAQ
jgi:hypothetical protein